ncbi:MAG: Co2+/Mg2+ efflux protein ApaG [Cytophagales bacterium]|nr:Co2+/Mg2+ efflux protein ApaG [Cytophagales bacterium]MDW8384921.1 Co2+/Mg2+ efflux protein ApaG [Flammeovirgaceae bacterium]
MIRATSHSVVSETTEGITVSVFANYEPDYSNHLQKHYVFTYEVTIHNKSEYTVQLLRRQWFIYDANALGVRTVEGEGVVGMQPVIEPGQKYTYVSGANLRAHFGKITGFYTMERLFDGKQFAVKIPEFSMIVPYRLN